MRITENVKYAAIHLGIRRSVERYVDANESVMSGKKINRPSDNPAGSSEVIKLRSLESSFEQYRLNMTRSSYRLGAQDLALERASDLISRAWEFASNADGPADGKTAAAGVSAILDEMVSTANTKIDGKYIFSGFKTSSRPFDCAEGSAYDYNGDEGDIEIAVGETRKIVVNLTGDKVFKGAGGGVDIFKELSDLKTALETDDEAGINSALSALQSAREQVENERARAASVHSEIKERMQDLDKLKLNLLGRISELEDVEMAEAITELSRMKNGYEVTLSASARLMEKSLIDFLR